LILTIRFDTDSQVNLLYRIKDRKKEPKQKLRASQETHQYAQD